MAKTVAKVLLEAFLAFLFAGLAYFIIFKIDWQSINTSYENREFLKYCREPQDSSAIYDLINYVYEYNMVGYPVNLEGIKYTRDLSSGDNKYIVYWNVECTEYYDNGHVKTLKITPIRDKNAEAFSRLLYTVFEGTKQSGDTSE